MISIFRIDIFGVAFKEIANKSIFLDCTIFFKLNFASNVARVKHMTYQISIYFKFMLKLMMLRK